MAGINFNFQNARGLLANIPILSDGQFYFATDTGDLYVGNSGTNQKVGTTINLETNGTPNGDQTVLNLVNGTNITITDDGTGDITIAAPSSLPPSGTAGGDLSGTYPNPTVAKVNGGSVPASQAFVGTDSSSKIIAATAGALPNGTTATTQAVGDATTDVATDEFVTRAIGPGTGAITFATAASLNSTSVQTKQLSLTINKGDCVVIGIASQNGLTAQPAPNIRDDAGNSYSCTLATAQQSGFGGGWIFVALNAKPATVVQVDFQANGQSGIMTMAAATYPNVLGVGTRGQANGSSTSVTVSISMSTANSFMVTVFGWWTNGAARTVSALTGNLRTNTAGTTTLNGTALVDNTQAGTGSETCAVTPSATTNWVALAIELIHN